VTNHYLYTKCTNEFFVKDDRKTNLTIWVILKEW